jgi:four helix bundle protein
MAAVTRFEDLGGWQKARHLTRRVYETTCDGPAAQDFAYRDQLRRAALSVMLNIAEGFERESGDKDFRHFLSIAKGSVGEVRAALCVGLDCGHLSRIQFDELHGLAVDAVRMLSKFIAYLDGCRPPGG